MFVRPDLLNVNGLQPVILSDEFDKDATQGFDATGKYYLIFQDIGISGETNIQVVYFDEESARHESVEN